MSLQTYIDNEVPGFAEWDSISEAGNSTVDQMATAGFPDRGRFGMRVTIDGTSVAFANKDYGEVIPAGGDFFFAFWLNVRVMPGFGTRVCIVDDALTPIAYVSLSSAGAINLGMVDDAGSSQTATYTITAGRWNYIQARVTRATGAATNDGTAEFWVNNYSVGTLTGKDNFNTFENNLGIEVGVAGFAKDGSVFDYDEIKTGTAYQQAWSPPLLTDLPEVRGTFLLVPDTADGLAFADYFVQQTGLPLSNVIILPNATTTEALATLAAWDTQVEDDLTAWANLATTAFAKAMTLIAGYELPGYFTDAGTLYSATSRLRHFGTPFAAGTANPLYAPTTVARLTLTDLIVAGVYLTSRIDADSLTNAKAVLDAGLAADLLTSLQETDILYSDDATFRAAVDTQHLRLETAAMA